MYDVCILLRDLITERCCCWCMYYSTYLQVHHLSRRMSCVEMPSLRLGFYGMIAMIFFVDLIFVWVLYSTLCRCAAQKSTHGSSKNLKTIKPPALFRSETTRAFTCVLQSNASPGSYSDRINLELEKLGRVARRSRRTGRTDRTRHYSQCKVDSIQEKLECHSKRGNDQGCNCPTKILNRRQKFINRSL